MDIINTININHKKILFSKPIKFENKYKLKVFVSDENSKKLNKLCLITPMFELNINWKTLKYQSFKINLDPLYGSILDFYELITKIEDKSLDELIKYFGDNILFKSIISEVIHYDDQFIDSELFNSNVLSLRLLKTTNVFDVNGKKTILNDLELQGLINYKFLLELTELWYDLDTKLCGCNFNVTQIKNFPPIYDHDFIINESIDNLQYSSHTIYYDESKGKGKGKSKGKLPPPPPKRNINILSTNIDNTVIEVNDNLTSNNNSKSMASLLLDPNTLKNAIANLKKCPI